jgi:putative endonuclease
MFRGRILRAVLRALDAITPAPRRAAHLQTGTRGEDEAYFHLRKLGYVMVARNFRSSRRKGELDLVGWDGDTLCFVEVKTRTTRDVKPAEAAVDEDKQRELATMAGEYMRRMEQKPRFRFDVVSVYYERGEKQINLYKGAFGT